MDKDLKDNGVKLKVGPLKVKITSVDIPFMQVLTLMVQVGLAAIPAGFIVACAYYIIITILGEL